MTLRKLLFIPLLAALLAAGCVAPGADAPDPAGAAVDGVPADWYVRALVSSVDDADHDHDDPAHHAGLSTPNFEVLGYDPLVTDRYGTTATGMGCGGTGVRPDDERRIAVVHTISTEVAFIVADITDPTKPVKLGEYLLPNAVVWDATVTPDGMHALVGAYPPVFGDRGVVLPPTPEELAAMGLPETWTLQPMWRDACTGETRAAGPEQYLPFGPGIVMVGLQDPLEPTFEDWVSQPVIGPHSVSSALIDGTLYAMSSVTNLVHEATYYSFFEIETLPATGAGKLAPLSVVRAPGVQSPELNGHIDVELHKHPVTGQVLAYLANWDGGLAIYDMSEPRLPVPLSVWAGFDSVHEALPLEGLWDGEKHYTFVGQEVGEPVDLPSGMVAVLDTTDPANPVEVSRWTIPHKPKWDQGGLMFSTHYLEVVNRTLFVANYHGGLWSIDLADPAAPRTTGVFVPDRVSPAPFAEGSYGPKVSDVLADENGVLTVWDGAGGIYQLRFHEQLVMPPVVEWPL